MVIHVRALQMLGVATFVFLLSPSCYPKGNPLKGFGSSGHGFTENKGQIIDQNNKLNPAVLYLLNTPGINVQLKRGGFSYDLYAPPRHKEWGSGGEVQFHRLDFTLLNSNPACRVIPSGPSAGYRNYYTSATPVTGVRSFTSVTCREIYPAIDLEFFTQAEHGYKYNFVIHPGGNIRNIRLKIDGPDSISLNGDTLTFATRFGDVEEVIPESYYLVNASRVEIKAHFRKISEGVYGFSVNQPIPGNALLVIDPTTIRIWGTYYGGSNEEDLGRCAADKAGNVFLTGIADSDTGITTPVVNITITATSTTVCSGTSVTFTAFPTSGGTSPLYHWQVNGLSTGTNSDSFTCVPLNGDVVTCVLTSSII